MILRASSSFAKRFKCAFSTPDPWKKAQRCMDDWSCHYVRVGTTPFVVAMHDATLYVLVIPVTGVKTFGEFLRLFLARVEETARTYNAEFDAANQSVIVLTRTDRSRIGSMNDAIQSLRFHRAHGDALEAIEARVNHTPYSAIDYNFPDTLLKQLLE